MTNDPNWNLQPVSLQKWKEKYKLKDFRDNPIDKTVDDTANRVSKALAKKESSPAKWTREFASAMRAGAIPAGRILANAGADTYKPKTSLINCVLSGTIYDTLPSIMDRCSRGAISLKANCGIGYEFSTLRPRNAKVTGGNAASSGPLSFMDMYSTMSGTIASAGGRRGAQMATFDVHHPDIEEFINAKRETGRLRQFNCSVLITNDFINAVKEQADWPLSFPAKENDIITDGEVIYRPFPVTEGYTTNNKGEVACKIYKTINARELFDKIVQSNYEYDEPGYILIDKVNEKNNLLFCEYIRASNPCITGDTWIQTNKGPRVVTDLINKQFTALINGTKHKSTPPGFFKTGDKPVKQVTTVEGHALRLTENHLVRKVTKLTRHIINDEWTPVNELLPGDRILINNHRNNAHWKGQYTEDEGFLIGLLLGDGTLKKNIAVLSVWYPAKAVNDLSHTDVHPDITNLMIKVEAIANKFKQHKSFKGWKHIPDRNEYRLQLVEIKTLANTLGMTPGNKTITSEIEQTSSAFYKGFLRGLFDADGSMQGNHTKGVSIRLPQSNISNLKAVQRMLLRLGINSTIYQNRRNSGHKLLPDGKGASKYYEIKSQHELIIANDNIRQFSKLIGFTHTGKQTRLNNLLHTYKRNLNRERFTAVIQEVKDDGFETVYDAQIPGINCYDANGFHAHNCGEQFLQPDGACLLGSLNLTKFIDNPFTVRAKLNTDRLSDITHTFSRMLDNVVDIANLPLPEQTQELEMKRRHGMGMMGLDSAYRMLGIPYGSDEAIEIEKQALSTIVRSGLIAGVHLAKEKGPAPILEKTIEITPKIATDYRHLNLTPGQKVSAKKLWSNSGYHNDLETMGLINDELKQDMLKYGSRYSHQTSIAPTGTIALTMGNNISSGIEPTFSDVLIRNSIIPGKKTKEMNILRSAESLLHANLPEKHDTDNINPTNNDSSQKNKQNTKNEPPIKLIEFQPQDVNKITIDAHIKTQSVAQQYMDSAISKTINTPPDIDKQEFESIYLKAVDNNLKGCTVYRRDKDTSIGTVLTTIESLQNTRITFTLENGKTVSCTGWDTIDYDGELHNAANLAEALKEGYYGKL